MLTLILRWLPYSILAFTLAYLYTPWYILLPAMIVMAALTSWYLYD